MLLTLKCALLMHMAITKPLLACHELENSPALTTIRTFLAAVPLAGDDLAELSRHLLQPAPLHDQLRTVARRSSQKLGRGDLHGLRPQRFASDSLYPIKNFDGQYASYSSANVWLPLAGAYQTIYGAFVTDNSTLVMASLFGNPRGRRSGDLRIPPC